MDGRVQDTRILKSIPMLDTAAVAAVRQWVFKPARNNGRPRAVWVNIPVRLSPTSPPPATAGVAASVGAVTPVRPRGSQRHDNEAELR